MAECGGEVLKKDESLKSVYDKFAKFTIKIIIL